ncbi:MAG: TetR/AcrR family transcriptional regulator, partial [Bacteroidota bacterium]
MTSRRQDIINKSVELFNAQGFYNVSLKEIAKALEISPGNLTYHFPKKADLLRAIQEEIIRGAEVEFIPEEKIGLAHLEKLHQVHHQNQLRYRFYFNNLLYMFKAFPDIAEAYREVSRQRLARGRELINYFVREGLFVPESEGINYDVLMKAFWMSSVFWTGQEAVLGSQEGPGQMDVLWGMTWPYLTEKGRAEYTQLQREKQPIL